MNIGKRNFSLLPVVEVDKEKCVNCHACIMACPVKYCNDGSGEFVDINHSMCIGCGSCLTSCTHGARYYVDDMNTFLQTVESGKPTVAIVAPSVAANFRNTYLNLNGWLKSLGVETVFDVSFGAELTVKSYVNHINSNKPQTVIAQPCPAVVTYLELYVPELLTYLAPVDSPMIHTMKMIKNYYPEYAHHQIAVISPCLAKKREFQELGIGDFNIAFKSVSEYMEANSLHLTDFPAVPYTNPVAERAVLFSTPGGLLETISRWVPGISEQTRRIEGVQSVYGYLEKLPKALAEGSAPLLVDCLNCEHGCNSGPLTVHTDSTIDSKEMAVKRRKNEHKEQHFGNKDDATIQKEFDTVLSQYWTPDLYKRTYRNLTMNNKIHFPSDEQLNEIYEAMHKYSVEDIYDCNACGYGTCENMAVSIHHGLNRPENCHFYMAEEARRTNAEMSENEKRLRTILYTVNQGFCLVDAEFTTLLVNPALISMLNTQKENLVGKKVFESQFKTCITEGKESLEVRVKSSDNQNRICLFTPTPYYEGETLKGYFAFVTDVTNMRRVTTTSTSVPRQ